MPTRSLLSPTSNASLSHTASLGQYQSAVRKRIARLQQQNFAQRFWAKDPTLWKRDKKSAASISNRLGWLRAPETMREQCPTLAAFAQEVRQSGFTHALLLGMGGSSLGAEVCRQTFGVAPGFLDLAVLDSTDPAQIRRLERRAPLEKTLFLARPNPAPPPRRFASTATFSKSSATRKARAPVEISLPSLTLARPLSPWPRSNPFAAFF
ncbi:MAG: hypothetical protein A3F68_13540 [Acidobacteria bacterium RIFCSPLOWO2_12_FULL_54_10]|nr:MAG: hypothetical protein A3F68_13540 [Acidobacteria bacterium RIFCSPLOWO2_12_FULL_54_10]